MYETRIHNLLVDNVNLITAYLIELQIVTLYFS